LDLWTLDSNLMPQETAQPIIVFVTAGSSEEAVRLADMLVDANLAACIQILPQLQSIYRWKGKVEREAEVLLIAKTLSSNFEELERRVREIHSYDTPEIVAVPATAISAPYSQWLTATLNSPNS
jgi:periplasmic divalent cation tolerance protein